MAGQIAVDVVLEPGTRSDVLCAPDLFEVDPRGIHNHRSRTLQIVHGSHEDLNDLRIRGVSLVRLPEHANPGAFETITNERVRVLGDGGVDDFPD